ncbi:hypothetical protein WA158_000297 [Blastocystis sp. Blastoise]
MTSEIINEPNQVYESCTMKPFDISKQITKKIYLEDQYLFNGDATVIYVEKIPAEDESESKKYFVVLDETLFYCKGGGQSGDIGIMKCGSDIFHVTNTCSHHENKHMVIHEGFFENNVFQVNDKIHMEVDECFRLKNTRLHSAGHLLDQAMMKIGYHIPPSKGNHAIGQCYVEYLGVIPTEERNTVIHKLQHTCDELVEEAIPTVIEYLDPKDVPHDTSYLLPGEKARIVHVGGHVDYPCAGTHVRTTKEIGHIIIEKIKVKKGVTHISYTIEGI